jgi:hypothetical protein
MVVLTYAESLAFSADYFAYLDSEECACSEAKHITCHQNMLRKLEEVKAGKAHAIYTGTRERIVWRMEQYCKHTQDSRLRAYAESVIAEMRAQVDRLPRTRAKRL